jgi:pimeloyl-ACP methyl ester carboxylesterase
MDQARLVQVVKQKFNAEKSPVVMFGNSYSGQLAAWMTMKFPNLVQASVASGAPILYYKDS